MQNLNSKLSILSSRERLSTVVLQTDGEDSTRGRGALPIPRLAPASSGRAEHDVMVIRAERRAGEETARNHENSHVIGEEGMESRLYVERGLHWAVAASFEA